METPDLSRFMDIPLQIEALIDGPKLRVRDLLALKAGSVIETARPAGENVDVLAGNTLLGLGELSGARGKVMVRILRFRGDQ